MARYVAEGDGTFLPGVFLEEITLLREPSLPLPKPITSAQDVITVALPLVRMAWRERFYTIPLNNRHQPLGMFLVALGATDHAMIQPVPVFMPCLQTASTACIVYHNHPSGCAEPSVEDRAITDRLRKAGEILGIDLVDHMVIGKERSYSFAMGGYIKHR